MQEKLARLHFSLDSHVEELSEDQRKCASDHNLEHLLCNVSKKRSSILTCVVSFDKQGTCNLSFPQIMNLDASLNIQYLLNCQNCPLNFKE